MGSVYNTVKYCCVCNGANILYAYNNGGDQDQETAKLAALCLQKAPLHHRWYFETMCGKTFGFLMEDGYVYFSIIDENVGGKKLEFLERVRDAFKKVAKNGSKRMMSKTNSVALQEQLLPVVRRLIDSLEHVSDSVIPNVIPNNDARIDDNGRVDLGASTKAPLLGKLGKYEKRKMRDHVITVREGGVVEEHRKADSSGMDLDHGGSLAGVSLTKEASSMSRSRSQTLRNKWYRQVRIVVAVDVAVCLVLFVVWMVVCRGTECIR